MKKVSCLCPTFGRVHLLEEAVESFLRQNYAGERELVICNDCDRQILSFDHPEVMIHNIPDRFKTIGAKRNHTASLATGDLLMTWGDDDIHLPSRISRMVQAMEDGAIMLEGSHYCLNGAITKHHYSTAGAHLVKAPFFWQMGGLAEINLGEDIDFNLRVEGVIGSKIPACKSEPEFVYRWASGRAHISWGATHYDKMGIAIHDLIAKGHEPQGHYHLNPHWKQDYVELVKTAILK